MPKPKPSTVDTETRQRERSAAEPSDEPCPECSGTGSVGGSERMSLAEWERSQRRCPECGESGEAGFYLSDRAAHAAGVD